jgi:hypothetical protein
MQSRTDRSKHEGPLDGSRKGVKGSKGFSKQYALSAVLSSNMTWKMPTCNWQQHSNDGSAAVVAFQEIGAKCLQDCGCPSTAANASRRMLASTYQDCSICFEVL